MDIPFNQKLKQEQKRVKEEQKLAKKESTKRKITTLKEKINEIAVLFLVVETILVFSYAALMHYGFLSMGERSVVIINPVRAAELPKKNEKKTEPEKSQAEKIADTIHRKETSNGTKDDKCERIGAHNGYGYGQGDGRNFCLGSDEEVRKLVVSWVQDKLNQGMTENQLLCYYNTGNATDSCTYLKI